MDNPEQQDATAAGAPNRNWQEVALAEPIRRGDTQIDKLRLRKPKAGELRGLTLENIVTTNISALLTLLPRISDPPLTNAEADELDPADLAEIGGTIRGFFMTSAERMILEAVIAEQQPRS